jgi:hypothetical protein
MRFGPSQRRKSIAGELLLERTNVPLAQRKIVEKIPGTFLVLLVNLLRLAFKELFDPNHLRTYPTKLNDQLIEIIATITVCDGMIRFHKIFSCYCDRCAFTIRTNNSLTAINPALNNRDAN